MLNGTEVVEQATTHRKNKILFYTGISGSGKDHLLRGITVAGTRPTVAGIQIINFGEALYNRLQLLQAGNAVSSRDDIKHQVPTDLLKTLIDDLTAEIIDSQPVVLNTHVAYKQNGSIQINPEVIRKLAPHIFVYVHADPEQIRRWRFADTSRQRDDEDKMDIFVHQEIALAATQTFALSYGSRIQVLHNRENNVTENLDMLYNSVQQLHAK